MSWASVRVLPTAARSGPIVAFAAAAPGPESSGAWQRAQAIAGR